MLVASGQISENVKTNETLEFYEQDNVVDNRSIKNAIESFSSYQRPHLYSKGTFSLNSFSSIDSLFYFIYCSRSVIRKLPREFNPLQCVFARGGNGLSGNITLCVLFENL
jgi:hypothetical protein